MLKHSLPQGYQRKQPPVSPKLGPYTVIIDQILESDRHLIKKQRHTARGNDKGKVEGLVGYARRNFMVPMPRVSSLDEFNQQLLHAIEKREHGVLRGH